MSDPTMVLDMISSSVAQVGVEVVNTDSQSHVLDFEVYHSFDVESVPRELLN